MKYALSCAVLVFVLFSNQALAENNTLTTLQQQIQAMQMQITQIKVAAQTSTKQVIAKSENTGNPSISVIANFTAGQTKGENSAPTNSFLPLSEAEFIFGANIDPHARLDITLTAAEGSMAVEEGFITSKLPNGFNLKSGRKFLPVGRVNGVHPHMLVYADRPNTLVNIFGPETFIGDGILIDRPWFVGDSVQTITTGVFSTVNDIAFDPTAAKQYAGLARWTGVWDTNDFSTLELGWTYVQGKNGINRQSSTSIHAAHLAWKYQNIRGFTLNIESEFLQSSQTQDSNQTLDTTGGYLLADFGLNRTWQLFTRYDYTTASNTQDNETALTAGVVWKLSEFQKLSLQYKNTRGALTVVANELGIAAGEQASSWLFRWVVAIGPHGAHRY